MGVACILQINDRFGQLKYGLWNDNVIYTASMCPGS